MDLPGDRTAGTGRDAGRGGGVQIDVLGPVRAMVDGRPVDLGSPKQRVVLAVLISAEGRPVSVDRVIDLVWPEAPPVRARHSVQQYVSRLRAALEPARPRRCDPAVLRSEPAGYSIALGADQVDMRRFIRDEAAGVGALCDGDAATAVKCWRRALSHWRGPAYADLSGEPFADAETARLDELRMFTIERRIAAELDLGHGPDLVPELQDLVRVHPLREALWGQLMVCLYRAGRQAEALATYQRVRGILAEQLGLDPGPGLQGLERAILGGDLAPPKISGLTAPALSAAADVVADSPSVSGERRTTVVISAALVGLEPLRSATDDRTVELLIDEAHRRSTAAITELAGSVMRPPGDALLGLFGVPTAAENDPSRAVQCALRVAAELGELSVDVADGWSVPAPSPRVAVCTAEVERGPDQELPARLGRLCAQLAEMAPGAAVVADDVRQLVDPLFEWGARVPGCAASIVVRSCTGPGRVQGLPGMTAPLLGREEPMARGREWLRGLLQGRGGVLFVVGEAGVGKTRFVDELRKSARTVTPAPLWLGASCDPHGDRVPYGPFRQLVRSWLGSTPLGHELRARVAAQRQLDSLPDIDAAMVLPVLLLLAGVSGHGHESARIAELDPEPLQRNIAAALTAWLGGLGADQPVVVAIDDMHWADQPSVELLQHLMDVLAGGAVAMLLAARPDPDHRSWSVRETARRRLPHRSREVVLEPLHDGLDTQLLRALVGERTLPENVERQIVDVADGNPFFLEEIIRSLVTSGVLIFEDDRWRLRGRVSVHVPPTVERIIISRLDALPSLHRTVLGAASVLGRTFSTALLAEVCAPDCQRDFDAIVEDLLRLAVLEELRRWPTRELQFNHALTVEAVYQSLTEERRAQLHERAARAIESGLRDGDSAAFPVLARHWEQAGDLASAAKYRRLAGDHALQVHALELARREFEVGLELAKRGTSPPETVAALTCGLGSTLRLAGQRDDARRKLLRAERLAAAADTPTIRLAALEGLGVLEETGASKRLALGYFEQAAELAAQVGDIVRQISLHNRLAVVAASQLRFADAHTSAQRALQLADRLGNPKQAARAIDGAKLVAWYLGDLKELERLAVGAEPHLRGGGEWYLQFVLLESAFVPAARGQWDEAMARIEEGLRLNNRIGNRAERPLLLALAARLDRWHGHFESALQRCSAACDLATDVGAGWMLSWAQAERGALLIELGAPDRAIPYLQEARTIAHTCSSATVELWSVGHLCRGTQLTADDRSASALAVRMSELIASVTVPPGYAFLGAEDALAAYAQAALALGDQDPAQALAAPMLLAAERAGHLPAQARASMVLAEVERQAGRLREAHQRLLHASNAATAGGLALLGLHAAIALAEITEGREQEAHLTSAAFFRNELGAH